MIGEIGKKGFPRYPKKCRNTESVPDLFEKANPQHEQSIC